MSILGAAAMKSGHCEQTDSHGHKLRYIMTGNYGITKHFWVNSFVDIERRCQVYANETTFSPRTVCNMEVSSRHLTAKFRVQSQASHVGFVAHKEAIGQVLIRLLSFSSVSINPPVFHVQSFIYH